MILAEGSHSAQLFTLLSGSGVPLQITGRRTTPTPTIGCRRSWWACRALLSARWSTLWELLVAGGAVRVPARQPAKAVRELCRPRLRCHLACLARGADARREPPECRPASATERAAYLIAFLYQRAEKVGLTKKPLIPITQQVADTLGLSIVHTNKTLRKIADRKLIRWHDRACEVLDPQGLADIAGWGGRVTSDP